MSKFPVAPASRQDIWKLVRNIRNNLGVEKKLYFDIVHFLEKVMPKIFPNFVLEICSEEEMGENHGETIPSEYKICIREDVYIGACKGKGRDRLTLAHEVGHFFMHDEGTIIYCRLAPNTKLPKFIDPDWQADVFAGELLAPSYLINGMDAQEVHKKCEVSMPCAERQLYAIVCEKKKGFEITPA